MKHSVCRVLLPILCILPLLVLSLVIVPHTFAGPTLIVTDLRCEYRVNPIGVDSLNPQFDWILKPSSPTARGLCQSSYRVIVSSSLVLLSKNHGDIWDTGKVISGQTNQIQYTGKALVSTRQYWWKVQSTDQSGNLSGWSQPATWTMGLLTPTDWQGAKWIGASPGTKSASTDSLLLRRSFPVGSHLTRAVIYLCGLGQYELTANDSRVGDAQLAPGWTQYDKTVLYDTYNITNMLHAGTNTLGILLGNSFYHFHSKPGRYGGLGAFHFTDSGPQQAIGLIHLEYADGTIKNIVTDTNWKSAAGPITFSSIYGGEDYDARLTPSDWDTPAILSGPGGSLKGLSCSAPPVRIFSILTPISSKPLAPNVTVYDLSS